MNALTNVSETLNSSYDSELKNAIRHANIYRQQYINVSVEYKQKKTKTQIIYMD